MSANEQFEQDDWDDDQPPKEFGAALSEREKYLPSSPLMQDFHAQVQTYGRLALVIGIIMGIATLIAGIGIAYLGIAVGAYGLIERKKWGLSLTKICLWVLLALNAIVSAVFSDDDPPFDYVAEMPFILKASILALSFPGTFAALAGLVIVYSKKMKYYCE